MEKKCLTCEKIFKIPAYNKKQKYCSRKCKDFGQIKRVEKTCLTCEIRFDVRVCQIKTRKYCSRACFKLAKQRGEIKGRTGNRKEIICQACQKVCKVPFSEAQSKKFCSMKCYNPSKKKVNIEKKCLGCEEMFFVRPYLKLRKYCSAKCNSFARRKRVKKICRTCKVGFEVRVCESERSKFCSIKCQKSSLTKPKIQKSCLICRRIFEVFPYNKAKKYCSKKCNGLGATVRIEKECFGCKTNFDVLPSLSKRRKFCSLECRFDYHKKRRTKKKCLNCEKEITIRPSTAKEKKYCSRHCYYTSASRNETNLEKILRLALESANITHEKQFRIGRHYVDFAIPSKRLAIEADGEYWHRDTERDAKRDMVIKFQGWRVMRFTGTEIKKNIEDCLVKIQNACLI